MHTYTTFHIFCGLGGGALGFQRAHATYAGVSGQFRTLGGVDVDPAACDDFTQLVGVPATCLDLFSAEDYTAWHDMPPPPTWREATPEDLRAAAQHERPDVLFTSPPCVGHSALLPALTAATPKYQAMNRLAYRGLALALAAWQDAPPGLILLENVPRITTRGVVWLAAIRELLRAHGYVLHEGGHDLGAVGGLAQHRRRYLLVARHRTTVPAILYQPPPRRVKPVGDVLSPLPPPDDPAAGPMHRLPRLQWRTWVRLALIPAGGDWRDLQDIAPGSVAITPTRAYFDNSYGVTRWTEPAPTVTSGGSPSCGRTTVADPRLSHLPRKGVFRVQRWDRPSSTVVGQAGVGRSNGVNAVADPRVPARPDRRSGQLAVTDWQAPASTVTGEDSVGGGAPSIADPRFPATRGATYHGSPGLYGVMDWQSPSGAVTGSATVSSSNAPAAVADPRLACTPRSGAFGVLAWDAPAPAVTGSGDVHAQGAAAVADPRLPADTATGTWVILAEDGTWHRPLTTLELAVLQGLPAFHGDDTPLVLAGQSHSAWRKRIGNAVPPPAAEAVATAMLTTLIAGSENLLLWNSFMATVWAHDHRRLRLVSRPRLP